MIELLNRYFVPVFTSNEDYRDNGSAPPDERAAHQRIYREALEKGFSAGTVHAYVVSPEGRVIGSLHTAEAARPDKLIGLLENAVAQLRTAGGSPVVKPRPPADPPCPTGSIRLNLTARYLEKKGDDYALVEDNSGNWGGLPAVDWICVPREEWTALVATDKGAPWQLPESLTRRLLLHFYPPTENSDITKNRIDTGVLTATRVSTRGSEATVRLDGRLRMKHPFYHKDDGRYVAATVLGYAVVDTKRGSVKSLHVVTDRADYFDAEGKHALPYGVAVRLAPEGH